MKKIISCFCLLLVTAWTAGSAFGGEIHSAARKGDVTRIKRLIEKNSDLISARDEIGRTPVFFAAGRGKFDALQVLLDTYHADPNIGDLNGITPLHTAARHGYPECVRILLDHGAYVNAKTRFDVTPLHFVVGQAENPERIEIIKMLIDFKADLNAVTKTGSTALGIAVYRQNSRIAGLLKGYDARFGPNRRDQSQIYSGVYNDYVNDDYLDDHDK